MTSTFDLQSEEPGFNRRFFLDNPRKEMAYYLYLPIKMGGNPSLTPHLPERLRFLEQIYWTCTLDWVTTTHYNLKDWYIYLTYKRMFVEPGSPGNRPGWHIDGWGSGGTYTAGDTNYVWADMNPTEYAVQHFRNISTDDAQSMKDITDQVDEHSIHVYHDCTIHRLNQKVVHRVNPVVFPGVRTFIKFTFSQHRLAREGNSHNYLLDYDWYMYGRSMERNLDHG